MLLSRTSDLIGASQAVSEVDPTYIGHCQVVEDQASIKVIAIVPNFQEASKIAQYAITPDGGYGNTRVLAAPGSKITHLDFHDWAFG